ncbi:peptide ABC transporter substrate-binding protein [Streptomyces hydrogenans]|uniref:peptide ABC transporter substrate-binding protein n=1 Tax=Streptomyces hydrogenans TaxID=1873719 RepID=UPI00331CA3B0
MKAFHRAGAGILALAAVTGLAACSTPPPAAAAGKNLRVYQEDPTSIMPQVDTSTQIGMALCANLMEQNSETGKLEPLVAESVTTKDNRRWTVKLKDWTFHDGTKVTASSYVDAWNTTAYAPNGYDGNGMFNIVQGYADLNPADGSTPKKKTLSGLKAVDAKTIEITLDTANVDLLQRLTTNPMCPLPKSYFDDPEAYAKKPVSNGPYTFESWEPNQQVVLNKWKDFPGGKGFTGDAEKLTFKIYTEVDAAYSDLVAGNLDLIRTADGPLVERAKRDIGDRAAKPIPEQRNQSFLAFPAYLKKYRDPALRAAISLAIDREAITASVLKGQAEPSDSLITPFFDGYRKGACTACAFDPAAAKRKLEEAKANGFDGTVKISYTTGKGANDQLMQAVAGQLTKNLGIKVELDPLLRAKIAEQRENGHFTGIYFGGWGLSYASEDQFLGQYVTGGDGNNANAYSNPRVDTLEAQALAALEPAQRTKLFQQVEDLVLKDMPIAPLYLPKNHALQGPHAEAVAPGGDVEIYRARLRG